jgi:hypothetical protein
MRARCSNPKCRAYRDYGGRGITVCQRWLDSYHAFAMDMGERPGPEYTLDRFPDKNGNYEPGNCRWATKKEQANNTRKNVYYTHDGTTKSLAEWAQSSGVSENCITYRIFRGMSISEAISIPSGGKVRDKPGPYKDRARILKYNGRVETMAEWARISGIPYKTLFARLQQGMSVDRALTQRHIPKPHYYRKMYGVYQIAMMAIW